MVPFFFFFCGPPGLLDAYPVAETQPPVLCLVVLTAVSLGLLFSSFPLLLVFTNFFVCFYSYCSSGSSVFFWSVLLGPLLFLSSLSFAASLLLMSFNLYCTVFSSSYLLPAPLLAPVSFSFLLLILSFYHVSLCIASYYCCQEIQLLLSLWCLFLGGAGDRILHNLATNVTM